MVKFHKPQENLEVIALLPQTRTSTNTIRKVIKTNKPNKNNKPPEFWFLKSEEDLLIAIREVISNEFFRLILPKTQPKSRLVYEESSKRFRIMTKEVVGGRELSSLSNVATDICNGSLKNAGFISIISLFINERDLHPGNILVDENNNLVKIDGGWSFGRLIRCQDPDFTDRDFAQLPYLVDFKVYNLFDIILREKPNPDAVLIDKRVTNNIHYRREVHLGALRLLIIPVAYLELFIDAYVSTATEIDRMYRHTLLREFLSYQQILRTAVLKNEAFVAFMFTELAMSDAVEFIEILENFTPYSKHKITCESLREDCQTAFMLIRKNLEDAHPKEIKQSKEMKKCNQEKSIPKPFFKAPQERSDLYSSPDSLPKNQTTGFGYQRPSIFDLA